MINTKRLLNLFTELVSIDSPSFGERQMANALTARLSALGFAVQEDDAGEKICPDDDGGETNSGNDGERICPGCATKEVSPDNTERKINADTENLARPAGNLYAYRKGDIPGAPLLFSAHMDTVEPAIGKKPVIHPDGRITGEGTTVLGADCMAGVAAILEAIAELDEEKIPTRSIEIAFFICEEKHAKGSGVFDFSRVKAREAYVLDVSGPVGIAATAAPTIINFEVNISGKAAHAGFEPEKGIHAVNAACKAISKLRLGSFDNKTVNIGHIEGGEKATNIVPERCYLMGEVRSLDHKTAMDELQNIREIFEKECAAIGAGCEFKADIPIHAYSVPEDHASIRRFKRACAALGLSGDLITTFGGSDESNLAKAGILGPVLSNGMQNIHSCDEYIEIGDLEKITLLTKLIMQDDID